MKVCANCKKERPVKDIYIALDNVYEKWCKTCRDNYRADSRVLKHKTT